MSQNKQLLIVGVGDASTNGEFESENWVWWIEEVGRALTQKEICDIKLRDEEGLNFITELLPHLPPQFRHPRLIIDGREIIRMPGENGQWMVFIFLCKCKEPQKIEAIAAKYFPAMFR